jgi:cytochrome P450
MLGIRAAVASSTQAICHAVDEISGWLRQHPADGAFRTDRDFLLRAVHEALRLHPTGSPHLRQATERTTLSDGTEIAAGQWVLLHNREANRDKVVFGPDADRFDPFRYVAPGVYPYGLTFGSGPHMCYGLPLVLGNEGVDGTIVHMVHALFSANVEPDPGRRAETDDSTPGTSFLTYPARFPN